MQANGQSARTFPARYPVLQLDRIYVRNARVHSPVVLPRRPWSHLSDHAPLAAEIIAVSGRWVDGNRIRLLENGEAFYPARRSRSSRAARKEVLLETFILFDDKVGRQLHAALLRRPRSAARRST